MATPFKPSPDYNEPASRGHTYLQGPAHLEGDYRQLNEVKEVVRTPTQQLDVRPVSGPSLPNPGAEFAGPNDYFCHTEQISGPTPYSSKDAAGGIPGPKK